MTAAALAPSDAAHDAVPPRNLLSVLWLQARALFERLSRFPGDHVRRIPALEALVRAYVCGAANDRLVADSALRRRLTEAALKAKETVAATLAGARALVRRAPTSQQQSQAKPQPQAKDTLRRLHAPRFDPLPSTCSMRPFASADMDDHPSLRPVRSEGPRPRRARTPSLRVRLCAGAAPEVERDATTGLLGRRAAALAHVANPEQRLAAIARVLADPEPAIRRAMRAIAARWEDHTLRFPKPEPDPVDDMPGEQAHIAHPRPQLAAALDRPDFEIVETFIIGQPRAEPADRDSS